MSMLSAVLSALRPAAPRGLTSPIHAERVVAVARRHKQHLEEVTAAEDEARSLAQRLETERNERLADDLAASEEVAEVIERDLAEAWYADAERLCFVWRATGTRADAEAFRGRLRELLEHMRVKLGSETPHAAVICRPMLLALVADCPNAERTSLVHTVEPAGAVVRTVDSASAFEHALRALEQHLEREAARAADEDTSPPPPNSGASHLGGAIERELALACVSADQLSRVRGEQLRAINGQRPLARPPGGGLWPSASAAIAASLAR